VRRVESIATNIEGEFYQLYKYPSIYSKLPISLKNEFEMSSKEFNDYNAQIKKGEI